MLQDNEYFLPGKFHQNPLAILQTKLKVWKVNDRRTGDGQCVITIVYLSQRLRYTKQRCQKDNIAHWCLPNVINNQNGNIQRNACIPCKTKSVTTKKSVTTGQTDGRMDGQTDGLMPDNVIPLCTNSFDSSHIPIQCFKKKVKLQGQCH